MWQRWIRYIRNFFGFTQGEARGFSVMAMLVLMCYAAWFGYRLLPAAPYQPQADQQQLDSLVSLLELADSSAGAADAEFSVADAEAPLREKFAFNPNTISHDSLLRLGFPPYLAKRLLNYREKGGRFRKKEDMQKLYGLEQDFYQELEPWIQVPPQTKHTQRQRTKRDTAYARKAWPTSKPAAKIPARFDLNTADSLQLVSVRGIGPVLSSRILKFRNALGGFTHAGQLSEVWGLPPEAAEALLSSAFVAPDAQVQPLPLNTADAALLARHPYISPTQARAIVAYRNQHGTFSRAEDLLKIHILDEAFLIRLAPYLQF